MTREELARDACQRIAAMAWREYYQVTVLYFGWSERDARELWEWAALRARGTGDDGGE